jgi:hypothetical protein
MNLQISDQSPILEEEVFVRGFSPQQCGGMVRKVCVYV